MRARLSVAVIVGVVAYVASMAVSAVAVVHNTEGSRVLLVVLTTIAAAFGAMAGVCAAMDRRLYPRIRSAWTWIAASLVLLAVANVLFLPHWTFFPAPPDICRLAVIPVLVTGLLRLPMQRTGRRHVITVALDAGTVAAAAGAFLWYLQVGPSVTAPGATAARIVAGSLYPLGDLILVFGLAMVLFRGDESVRRPVQTFFAASIPWLVGDTAVGYQQTHSTTNRLYEELSMSLGRAGRQGHTTAVLLADLNGFKQVNDTMGHAAGDRLWSRTARCCAAR